MAEVVIKIADAGEKPVGKIGPIIIVNGGINLEVDLNEINADEPLSPAVAAAILALTAIGYDVKGKFDAAIEIARAEQSRGYRRRPAHAFGSN